MGDYVRIAVRNGFSAASIPPRRAYTLLNKKYTMSIRSYCRSLQSLPRGANIFLAVDSRADSLGGFDACLS